MPRLHLTKRNIDAIPFPPKGQVDYFDTELKGLALRVGRDVKTFFVQIDVFDQGAQKHRTVKGKLGRYGEITPEQARREAPKILQKLREGKSVAPEVIPTLDDLYKRYLKDKPLAASTRQAYSYHVGPKFASWLELPLSKIASTLTPDVVISRYQQIRETSGYGAAQNSFKCLQSIIKYGSILYPQFLAANPVRVISEAKLWAQHRVRDDLLEPEQFPLFWEGLLRFTPVHRDCFLVALYQGWRPNEAQSLRWDDVNLETGIAHLRHETESTKRSYTVPLCSQVLEICKRRQEAREKENPFVFPSDWHTGKRGHVTLRAEKLRQRTGLDLTVHGLRRTFITMGERLRLRREDINLLTGHVDHSVTGRHYTRLTADDLRPILQRIANEMERLMKHEPGGKVIPLNALAARE